MTVATLFNLRCHITTLTRVVRKVQVSVERTADAELSTLYRVEGDVAQIRVPAPTAPRIGRELWRHTCFEVFLRIDGRAAYHEFNLAPSREWTVYALSSYRSGGPLTDESMDPHIVVRSTDNQFELDAKISLGQLSPFHPNASLSIGLAAVIETIEGVSYWALRHPGAKPDFHHADSFALLVPFSTPRR